MSGRFAGKAALITGAGSGIGRASAIAFAAEGATAVIADISADGGEQTVRMIEDAGGRAEFVKCNVSQSDSVKALIDEIVRRHGRLDYAHNNAGIEGQFSSTVDCCEENWDQVMNVNLRGVWLSMKYQIPQMLKQGGGAIVNTASVAGLVGFAGLAAYVASKHGIVGLTKAAALECARHGVRINAVCPAVIRTPLIERFYERHPEMEEAYTKMHPIGRIGTPEEVARTVVFLCSDAASFVTGVPMPVDGGVVAT